MSTISTFSGFTMARLGIMASQKALEVTGNNISNINTVGYTRQALKQKALYIGGADKYASQFDVRVGSGTLTTGVSQLRDPYLDIRYRNELGNVGFNDAKLSVLEDLNRIFDEVGKGNEDNGVIEAQLNDILEQLQNMNTEHAGQDDYDAMVRESCKALAGWFNTYAGQLKTLETNTMKTFTQDISRVNNILTSIRELNESIKKAEIANGAITQAQRQEGLIGERGNQALELRDERNLLIDELSQYLPIDVKYSDEPIGAGMYVEKLTITIAGMSDKVLVDGNYSGKLSLQQVVAQEQVMEQAKNEDGSLKFEADGVTPVMVGKVDANGKPVMQDVIGADGKPVMIDDPALRLQISALTDRRGETIPEWSNGSKVEKLGEMDLSGGSIQAIREMLTRQGEFSTADQRDPAKDGDPKAATKRGIPFYQKALDALANKFATMFNKANMDAGGGPLFSVRGDSNDTAEADGTPINASNISIATDWAHGKIHIQQSKDPNNTNSSANDNIVHLITLMNKDLTYNAQDTDPDAATGDYFTGTFNGMLGYINGVLGNDSKSTIEVLDNFIVAAEELEISRDSVAGVDLNDEAVNMMQYQKSYSAACRLLTTLDEILEKLINGTGVAGR
ncbi:MAG: hypothetical protein HFE94_03180 [Acutalibacter sp.]|nr:hypothetical protein [Acutalibacter sp.]